MMKKTNKKKILSDKLTLEYTVALIPLDKRLTLYVDQKPQ